MSEQDKEKTYTLGGYEFKPIRELSAKELLEQQENWNKWLKKLYTKTVWDKDRFNFDQGNKPDA